jgi:flagellin-like hook-associated protein FlgL
MIIVVLFFESFFTTSTQAKMLYYIENINFVANMLYYKEKAIQNMVNALMKNKENVSITEIKSKNEKDDIDKPED